MQLNAFGHMALASWDTSNQNVVINLGNWLLALNISKPIKHHSFCIIILQLFYTYLWTLYHIITKCKAGFQSAANPSILKLLTLTDVRSRWIGDFCDHLSTRCAGISLWTCHWCRWTNPPPQRPSGAHLLLLVDDVETWNSKLKEMEGGLKKPLKNKQW